VTNTQNTPIEALERAFPMRVLRYRLRLGSGGAGFSPGGEGIERDLQVLEDCTLSLITEHRVSQPWGLWGGGPGAIGENWLLPGGDESRAERLPDKCTMHLKAGDVVRMLTPGGGGWAQQRPDPRREIAGSVVDRPLGEPVLMARHRTWIPRCRATDATPAVRQPARPTSTYSTGLAPWSSEAKHSGWSTSKV